MQKRFSSFRPTFGLLLAVHALAAAMAFGAAAVAFAAAPPASGTSAAQQAEAEPEPAQQLEAFEVSASRLKATDVENTQPIEHYDSTQIEESGAFTVDEFFETLPPGDDDEEQLVLIDGVPAYLDPSMLALGMIEGIDVALEGSMPQYGARADGRVINIRLKKEFTGAEIGGRTSHSFAGGGSRQDGKFSGAIARGRYRLIFSVTHDVAEGLRATA
ncbi:MAG TPA: hypothetical protein VHF69_14715, partial [Candidatus Synoicihabitans sp.]|nr:hypothetical protein [Candidatus Synoicihabitans sp.]